MALHWPHRPKFHFWAFDLQWWWIGIFVQSMTTHGAFGMAQWQWLKKMWINLHMGKFIHIFGRQSVTEWNFTLRGQHPIGAGLVKNDSIG